VRDLFEYETKGVVSIIFLYISYSKTFVTTLDM